MQEVRIYIPTKGRADSQSTAKLLNEAGLSYVFVIEPQEAYLFENKNTLVLPDNDKGIQYVRNYILNHARQTGIEWLIMIDDDIRGFGVVKNHRCINKGATVINEFISMIKELPANIVLATINYRQFAWRSNKAYTIDSLVEVFTAINVKRLPNNISYNSNVLPEDRDFLLQVLISGNHSVCFNDYWFSCPKTGSNKGGLYDTYKNGTMIKGIENLKTKWEDMINLQLRKDNTVNVKINRKKIEELLK
jgi:hypothetical protein